MVYESCEVSHVALEDLIRARAGAANHYIDTLHAVGYQPDKFSYRSATVQVLFYISGGYHRL